MSAKFTTTSDEEERLVDNRCQKGESIKEEKMDNQILGNDFKTKRETAEVLRQLVELFESFGISPELLGPHGVKGEVALAVGISVERVDDILQAETRNMTKVYYRDRELVWRAASAVGLLNEKQEVCSRTLLTLEDKRKALQAYFEKIMQHLNRRNNARTRSHIVAAVSHVIETAKKIENVLPKDRVHMLHWRCAVFGPEVMMEAYVQAHSLDALQQEAAAVKRAREEAAACQETPRKRNLDTGTEVKAGDDEATEESKAQTKKWKKEQERTKTQRERDARAEERLARRRRRAACHAAEKCLIDALLYRSLKLAEQTARAATRAAKQRQVKEEGNAEDPWLLAPEPLTAAEAAPEQRDPSTRRRPSMGDESADAPPAERPRERLQKPHRSAALCAGFCVQTEEPEKPAAVNPCEDVAAPTEGRQSSRLCPPPPQNRILPLSKDKRLVKFLFTEGKMLQASHVDVIGARYAFVKLEKLQEVVTAAEDVFCFDIERNTTDRDRRIVFFSHRNEKLGSCNLMELWANGETGQCSLLLLNSYYGERSDPQNMPKHCEPVGVPVFVLRTTMRPPDSDDDEELDEPEDPTEDLFDGEDPAGEASSNNTSSEKINDEEKATAEMKPPENSEATRLTKTQPPNYASYTITEGMAHRKGEDMGVELGVPRPQPNLFFVKQVPESALAASTLLNDVFPFYNVGPAAKDLLQRLREHTFDPADNGAEESNAHEAIDGKEAGEYEEVEVKEEGEGPNGEKIQQKTMIPRKKHTSKESENYVAEGDDPKAHSKCDGALPENAYIPENLQELVKEAKVTESPYWFCADENPYRAYPIYLDIDEEAGASIVWYIFTSLGKCQLPKARKVDLKQVCTWDPEIGFEDVTAANAPPGAHPALASDDAEVEAAAKTKRRSRKPGHRCPKNAYFPKDIDQLTEEGAAEETQYWYCTNPQKKKAYPLFVTPVRNHLWLFYNTKGKQRIPAARKKDLKFLYTWTPESGFETVTRANPPLGGRPDARAPPPPPGSEVSDGQIDEQKEEPQPPTAFVHPNEDQLVEDFDAQQTNYWFCAALGKKPVFRLYLVEPNHPENPHRSGPSPQPAACEDDSRCGFQEDRSVLAPSASSRAEKPIAPLRSNPSPEGNMDEAFRTETSRGDEEVPTPTKKTVEADWLHFTPMGPKFFLQKRQKDLQGIYTWSAEEGFHPVTAKNAPPGAIGLEPKAVEGRAAAEAEVAASSPTEDDAVDGSGNELPAPGEEGSAGSEGKGAGGEAI